jgi:hypothetical protein
MSSSSSNNVGDNAWLLQMELRREAEEEVTMEEDEGDSLEVHPSASERGTHAGISTNPNPHQAMRTTTSHGSQEVQEGLAPRRPLHRLHQKKKIIIWFTIMELKILPACTYLPIGTSLVQVKVMQRINISWPKSKRMQR